MHTAQISWEPNAGLQWRKNDWIKWQYLKAAIDGIIFGRIEPPSGVVNFATYLGATKSDCMTGQWYYSLFNVWVCW